MKRVLLTAYVFLLLLLNCAFAQTSSPVDENLKRGVKLVDEGKIDEGIALLNEAQKLEPNNITITYELAYAFFVKKDFKRSTILLEPLVGSDNAKISVFQLLGNAYDEAGDSNQALKTYQNGLKKFPNAGALFLESGVLFLKQKKYDQALAFFESGIKNDPKFASNYYWASKLYFTSTSEVWGMLYGEIFMNLEQQTKRTAEMSKLLYDTYLREIKFANDASVSVSFCKESQAVIKNNKLQLPFGTTAYEMSLLIALAGEKNLNIEILTKVRTKFINVYYEKWDKDFPNVLFDFNKKILDAGHAEAYNHWVLMQGDVEAFKLWLKDNETKWKDFITWFQQNKIQIDLEHHFYSSQYK